MPLQILDTESGKWFEIVEWRGSKVGDLYLTTSGQVAITGHNLPNIRRHILKPIDPPGAECEVAEKLAEEATKFPAEGEWRRIREELDEIESLAASKTTDAHQTLGEVANRLAALFPTQTEDSQ